MQGAVAELGAASVRRRPYLSGSAGAVQGLCCRGSGGVPAGDVEAPIAWDDARARRGQIFLIIVFLIWFWFDCLPDLSAFLLLSVSARFLLLLVFYYFSDWNRLQQGPRGERRKVIAGWRLCCLPVSSLHFMLIVLFHRALLFLLVFSFGSPSCPTVPFSRVSCAQIVDRCRPDGAPKEKNQFWPFRPDTDAIPK